MGLESNLDGQILVLKCSDPLGSRGNRLLALMADEKAFNEFCKHEKLNSVEALRKWCLQPMKNC